MQEWGGWRRWEREGGPSCHPGRSALTSLSSLMCYRICMVAEPGGCESVPHADSASPGSESVFSPLPPGSARTKLIPAAGRRRCGAWGASLGPPKGADREQEGGLQRLGAKFSSALFWVTTFTMFLHPESFRLPARLRCFQLMGSHASLTTGLVQGLPGSLTAALQAPHHSAGCPRPRGDQNTKLGHPRLFSRGTERCRSWKQRRMGGEGERQSSGTEMCRQLTFHFL